LLVLLGSTFFIRAFWAVAVPAFQTPDEPQHFGYVQDLGERPRLQPNDFISEEIGTVESLTGLDAVPFHPAETQMFSANSLNGPKEDALDDLPSSLRTTEQISRPNSASQYPPTYYLIASLVYRALAGFDTLTILVGVRLLSALLTTGAMLFGYLTLRRFFADPATAKAAALIVALQPMYAYMGMAVNVDALVWLIFSVFLYLITRAIDEGLTFEMNMGIGLTLAFGLLTKQTFLVAVPIYVVLLCFLWYRKMLQVRQAATYLGTVLAMLVVLDGWLYVSGLVRTSPSYAGEHERTARSLSGFLNHLIDYRGAYANTFNTAWGAYGWLDTYVSLRVFGLIRMLSAVATVGLAFYLLQTAVYKRFDTKTAFFVAICGVYVAAWVVLNYLRITSGESWLLQGRYFFPMIVPIIALLLRGLLWYIPHARVRDVFMVALVIGVLWLNADSLAGYVIPRFYA
jgi:4-amino-4-deoxy-L-arabinose transferase-like glycosyltransferase